MADWRGESSFSPVKDRQPIPWDYVFIFIFYFFSLFICFSFKKWDGRGRDLLHSIYLVLSLFLFSFCD